MSSKLTLLIVGTTDRLADSVAQVLHAGGYEPAIVEVGDLPDVPSALSRSDADLLVCHPGGNGRYVEQAVAAVETAGRDTPVLVIADSEDPDAAVDAIRCGAADWIGRDHLDRRLLPSVERALRTARRHRRRYHDLAETLPQVVFELDHAGRITFVNSRGLDFFGYTEDDLERRPHIATLIAEEERAQAMERIGRVLEGEVLDEGAEYTVLRTDGTRIPVMVYSTPIIEGDEIVGLRGALIDLRDIRGELLRIKTALDNASDAIGMADGNQVPVYLNPSFQEMFGYTAEELREAGGPIANFAREEDYERVFEQVRAEEAFIGEFEGRHVSGRTFPVMGRVDAVRDERGELTGIVAVFSDITKRRRREERRRLTTARLSLLNQLNQMLNAGESVDEIIETAADELCESLRLHHVHIFLRRQGDDGEELFLRYSNMPAEAETRVFGRPLGEDDIRIPLRPDTRVWEMYQKGESLEIRGAQLDHTATALERWAVPEPIVGGRQILEELGMRYLCLLPLMRGGEAIGHITVSRCEDEPLSEAETELVTALAQQVAVILERARSEREISRLNHFLEAIIENAAVWFSVLDEDQQIVIWNRAAREISGYAHEKIESGAHLMKLLYPDVDDRAEAYQYVEAAFDAEDLEEFETTITRADGAQCRIAWHLRRFMTDERRVGLVVVGRDVTESRELQEQLDRVQRMNAVGTLAGGVAHDFNNVLTAIIGHADLLSTQADDNSSLAWHGEQIAANARRASRLTRQLLAFSRKQASQPKIVDLNRLIREMEEMFRRMISANIHLHLELSQELDATRIDPSQVEQIVMNLVLNARDAMPDGGELTVRTANAELSPDSVGQLFEAKPGDYETVEVVDTGMGMDEETESHIFEPFFTTRQGSGGIGLGLSTVYGLVRQNDGAINVYSEPGEGTTFRVYLPRVDGEQTVEPTNPAGGDRQAVRGDETLLVVEDADSLRELIVTILTSFGYTVFSAGRGQEALDLEREHHGEIDLVVSDVVMPGMSGTELADRLLEADAKLRVLFISGYPNERAVTVGQSDPRFSFMQKPFSAMELGSKVREILDGE